MAQIIKARVWQKVDTEANWNANPLILGAGEQAFVVNSAGLPINFKVGDGTKRFSQLPWSIQYAGGQYIQLVGNVLPAPTVDAGYSLVGPGTYTFSGQANIVAPEGRLSQLLWDGTSWSLVDMGELPQAENKIHDWTAQSYTDEAQVIKDGKIWSLAPGETASDTDVPGVSAKWFEKVGNIGSFLKNEINGRGDSLSGWSGSITLSGTGNFVINANAAININNAAVTGSVGDKIYVAAEMLNVGTQTADVRMSTTLSGSTKDLVFQFDITTPFNENIRRSRITTVTSDFNGFRIFKQATNYNLIINLKNFGFVNLTQVFGAGNEPSLKQMDALMEKIDNDWFSGDRALNDDEYGGWQQETNAHLLGVKEDSVKVQDVVFLELSSNILDRENSKNGIALDSGGLEIVDPEKATSLFIETYDREVLRMTTSAEFNIFYYDKNKQFISSSIKQLGGNTLETPFGASYFRAVFDANTGSLRINRGSAPLNYEPFGAVFKEGVFLNNPDKTAEGLATLSSDVQDLSLEVQGIIDSGVGEKVKQPVLGKFPVKNVSSGLRIYSSYEDRTFGLNGSGSQIWYFEKGDISRYSNLITGTSKQYTNVLAISRTSVLALSGVDNGLYLVSKVGDSPATETKVLDWIVNNPSFSFGVDCYPKVGGARIILMAEYGDKDPVNYPRHVHLSEDGGLTWRVIFELPNETSNRTHTHGVHYDPYADRIWICNGDGPAYNTWYIDNWRDASPTYTRLHPPNEGLVQFTSISSTPEMVLFGTDGGPNGIWCIEKDLNDQKKTVLPSDLKPLYIIDESPDTLYVGGVFTKYDGFGGIYVILYDAGTSLGTKILGSYDGKEWYTVIEFEPSPYRVAYMGIYKNMIMYTFGTEHVAQIVDWV